MVDSNVLLDVLEEDAAWYDWSAGQLERIADSSALIINPVIYAKISIGFQRIEELEAVLLPDQP